MRGRRLATAAIALILAPAEPASACGPDFPASLLADRGAAMVELDDGVFLDDATRLVAAPVTPYPYVDVDPYGARTHGADPERALYDRGAAAFAAGERPAAITAFRQLLALPRDQRLTRSTWAAYMLGRSLADPRRAVAAFRRVRALVDAGFTDELGLAAASLGEEARLALADGRTLDAVRLYAEQAANGHPAGATSLLFVVRDAIAQHATDALATDPVGQRLLAAYLLDRPDELADADRDHLWQMLTAAPTLAGADRLAAAAYRAGHWDQARELALRDPHAALAMWVQAKLALRDGDLDAADALLAQVAAAIDAERGACPALDRVTGERAVIALSDRRPTDAMALAWRVHRAYPTDAIYIAERVLAVDELRAFVDAVPDDPADADADPWEFTTSRAALRGVLARRLMRAGAFADAERYVAPRQLGLALAFAGAIDRGRTAADPIERARALFTASVLARQQGLELLGTEHAPDWAIYGADYAPDAVDPDADPSWITAAERDRVAASAPAVDRRFHYRFVASRLAEQAADLLPHRSQAYAAALCHATRDIFHDDPARVATLYRRYVRTGPAVDFAATFGETCPVPAFELARRYLGGDVSGGARRGAPIAAALAAAVLVALLALTLTLRRLRATA